MAMDRQKKETVITSLGSFISEHSAHFLVDYKGLNVAQMQALRGELGDESAKMRVVKNTLLRRAAAKTPLSELDDYMTGPVALVGVGEDPVAVAKVLTGFQKKSPALELKAGILDGEVLDSKGLEALASLPSKDQLYAQLLYVMLWPAQGFVTALQGVARNLVNVLDQIKEQKES